MIHSPCLVAAIAAFFLPVLGGLAPLPAQDAWTVLESPEEGEDCQVLLSLTNDRKHVLIDGGAGEAPFALFAGLAGSPTIHLADGLTLEFTPLWILALGRLDATGHTVVGIDLQSDHAAGVEVGIQAVTIAADSTFQLSNVRYETIEATQTWLVENPRPEPIYVVESVEDIEFHAVMMIEDSVPPRFTGIVLARTPTTGFTLRVESIRWNHDFARVTLAITRPAEPPIVDPTELHRIVFDLGTRVEQVEVVLSDDAAALMHADAR